ncbi:MAG: hypothetical protein NTX25_10995, partial [Proteobacteria bacterium]|nr:hypothetical protein [Pseudomonadota bacterium]
MMLKIKQSFKAILSGIILISCGVPKEQQRLAETLNLSDIQSNFVQRQGQNFKLKGQNFFFQGTSLYEIGLLNGMSEADVENSLRRTAEKGLTVVRIWGFCNGDWNGTKALQTSPDHFTPEGLRRMDWAINKAGELGLKIIFVFVNYEKEYGGMQWWVDQVLGPGRDLELFYSNALVQDAYRKYAYFWLNHRNEFNGRLYKEDPTIMAWELANEAHTRDNYEKDRGLELGKLSHEWLWNMAEYLDYQAPLQLLSTGEEGYRREGRLGGPYEWINNGFKGADYVGNMFIPWIDFGTVHVYPDLWGIPYADRNLVTAEFLLDRYQVAQNADKPLVLEEIGFRSWYGNRNQLLNEVFQTANRIGYQGTMAW